MSEELGINKDLNFATTIRLVPYLNMVASVEEMALKIPKVQTDELRLKTREALEMAKPPKLNISSEERFVIRTLQSDSSIIMLPSENGNASMVMNNIEYSKKLTSLVGYGI